MNWRIAIFGLVALGLVGKAICEFVIAIDHFEYLDTGKHLWDWNR